MRRLYVRHRRNLAQLLRFGIVGASGVIVNMLVVVLCNKLAPALLDITARDILIDLPFTRYNVRGYHAFSFLAFFVANVYNYQLNRMWTFRSAHHASWFTEYIPFVAVGLLCQSIGSPLLTLLMHDESPIGLPNGVFDNSNGLRTKLYWAQLIMIGFMVPLQYLLNKFWTFRAIRHRGPHTELPMVAPVVDPDEVTPEGDVVAEVPDDAASLSDDSLVGAHSPTAANDR